MFVSGKKGARYALTAKTWQDGSVIAGRTLSGIASGSATVVSLRG